jgi:hypothetical protein
MSAPPRTTRFKETTGNGFFDFIIDFVGTSESVLFWMFGKPGEAFEAGVQTEITKGNIAALSKYLKAWIAVLLAITGTGAAVGLGFLFGKLFESFGLYTV